MLSSTIKIKDEEFFELRDIIYKNSAIAFSESKKYLLENRLSKRLQELNFTAFKDYIYYLKYDLNKNKEMETLLNLVTINETYFLRERPQMDHMITNVIPSLIAKGKRSIRIWSSASSTGEEAYSIAILLKEAGFYNRAEFDIVATDINSEVVAAAKKGEYRNMSFRGVPANFQALYFEQKQSVYQLKDEIRQKVKFSVGNLISPSITALGHFDIIYCRNVLIYFDMDAKKRVIETFYNMLNRPGYLYLGHSESIAKFDVPFVMNNFSTGIVHIKE